MRVAASIVATFLVVSGIIWFLQGINVLPGSFMTGQIKWAVYGGIAVVVGGAVLAKWGRRRVILNTLAVIVLLTGTLWILQGVDVLRGTPMSGATGWAIAGAITDVIGIGVLLLANRRAATAAA
jgi:hypothetical protein